MKLAILPKLIFILLLLNSVSVWANCLEGPRHHVFLLHGIGGNKGTFGSLEEILNKQHPCQKARTFEYRTGSQLTTYDFAQDFHQYVTSLPPGEIRSFDKISLVMHSQGGLVGSLWLKLMNQINNPLLKQVDSFITLSTPFWGADIANIGKRFFYTLPPGVENPISPFGRNELNEMSYGSSTIQDLVKNLDTVFVHATQIRPLIIGGMKKYYNSKLGEDDVVVPTYSMRPERFYFRDVLDFFEKPRLISAQGFEKNPEKPFIIVPADHINLGQYGVADIPKSCIRSSNCGHPALRPILDHLKGTTVSAAKNYKLTRFRVTMFVNNPHKVNFDPKDLTIMVHGLDRSTRVPFIERFKPRLGNAKLEHGLAFSFGGIAERKGVSKILVTLKFKNKSIKTYEVPVEAGLSSFIDVDLAALN